MCEFESETCNSDSGDSRAMCINLLYTDMSCMTSGETPSEVSKPHFLNPLNAITAGVIYQPKLQVDNYIL